MKKLAATFTLFLLFFGTSNAQVVGGLAPSLSLNVYENNETRVGFGGDFLVSGEDRMGVTGSYNFTGVEDNDLYEYKLNQHQMTFGPVIVINQTKKSMTFVGFHGGANIFSSNLADESISFESMLLGLNASYFYNNTFIKARGSYSFESDEINDFFSFGVAVGIAFK